VRNPTASRDDDARGLRVIGLLLRSGFIRRIDRRLPPVKEFLHLERMARASDELDVVPHGRDLVGKQHVEPRVVQPSDHLALVAHAFFAWGESVSIMCRVTYRVEWIPFTSLPT